MSVLSNKGLDEILALGRLYEFCSNKRFHLIRNEFINDFIGKKALHLNSRIKLVQGIDLFEATSENDLLEYERVLNSYTTQFSDDSFGYIDTTDEVAFLKTQVEFPPDRINSFGIEVQTGLKQYIKKFPITIPALISACKKPDYVSYLEETFSYFITKKIKIGVKEKILFAHMTLYDKNQQDPTLFKARTNYLRTLSTGAINIKTPVDELMIRMILIFDYDKFQHLLNSPVKLFLKGLDLYGMKTEISGVIKKLFFDSIMPANIYSRSDFYKVQFENKDANRTTAIIKPSKLAIRVLLLYTINMTKLLNAFLYGNK
jgi:hypothetical protein